MTRRSYASFLLVSSIAFSGFGHSFLNIVSFSVESLQFVILSGELSHFPSSFAVLYSLLRSSFVSST